MNPITKHLIVFILQQLIFYHFKFVLIFPFKTSINKKIKTYNRETHRAVWQQKKKNRGKTVALCGKLATSPNNGEL